MQLIFSPIHQFSKETVASLTKKFSKPHDFVTVVPSHKAKSCSALKKFIDIQSKLASAKNGMLIDMDEFITFLKIVGSIDVVLPSRVDIFMSLDKFHVFDKVCVENLRRISYLSFDFISSNNLDEPASDAGPKNVGTKLNDTLVNAIINSLKRFKNIYKLRTDLEFNLLSCENLQNSLVQLEITPSPYYNNSEINLKKFSKLTTLILTNSSKPIKLSEFVNRLPVNITYLNLSNNNITCPATVKFPSYLTTLILNGNPLGPLVKNIFFGSVKKLSLYKCGIKSMKSIRLSISFQELDLSYNSMNDFANNLKELTNLKKLNINGNQFEKIVTKEMIPPNINELTCVDNLKQCSVKINNLTQLSKLQLSSKFTSFLEVKVILSQLTTLDLKNYKVESINHTIFKYCDLLTVIRLVDCHIGKFTYIESLRYLRILSLQNSIQEKKFIGYEFPSLINTKIGTLNLSHNSLKRLDILSLSSNITEIDLRSNALRQEIKLKSSKRLSKLKPILRDSFTAVTGSLM